MVAVIVHIVAIIVYIGEYKCILVGIIVCIGGYNSVYWWL